MTSGRPQIAHMTLSIEGSVARAVVSGELDASSAPAIERKLLQVISDGNDLVVDIGAVSFIDSSALRMFLNWSDAADQATRGFVIVSPAEGRSAAVNRVMELTQLEGILPIVASANEALTMVARDSK